MLTRGTIKPSGGSEYGLAGNAGALVGGRWGQGGAQKGNLRDTDSFSTYFLRLEGVNILYPEGFEGWLIIVHFPGKLKITEPSDSQQ